MLIVRRAEDRGHTHNGWLHSYHTFSFGHYHDEEHNGYGMLKVLNENALSHGTGFSKHNIKNMEIVSYVLQGSLAHTDSLGNTKIIKEGEVQILSAGSGVEHSEFNPSETEPTDFIQAWIVPSKKNIEPTYAQKHVDIQEKRGKWCLLASPEGLDHSLKINQHIFIYSTVMNSNDEVDWIQDSVHKSYFYVASGKVMVNDTAMAAGDGFYASEAMDLKFYDAQEAEIVAFYMPA